jgi:hypothetical protein
VVAGTLLETVERFIQLEDFVILIESSGNPHKEGCVDVCLNKGSDIVYFLRRKSKEDGYHEKESDSCPVDRRSEGVCEVNSFYLPILRKFQHRTFIMTI